MKKKTFYILVFAILAFNLVLLASSLRLRRQLPTTKNTATAAVTINLATLEEELRQLIQAPTDQTRVSVTAYDGRKIFGVFTYQDQDTCQSYLFRGEYWSDGSVTQLKTLAADADYSAFIPKATVKKLFQEQLSAFVAGNQEALAGE